MTDPKKGFSVQEAAALAAGAVVVVVAAFLTTRLRPIPFPLNFALSLGLGAATSLGALTVLDPRTARDRMEDEAEAEYRAMLGEMQAIAARAAAAGQFTGMGETAARGLLEIAAVVRSIANRYASVSHDFAGASAILTTLKQFDLILAYYLRIKSGRQHLAPEARASEIAQTEERTIPLLRAALEKLARQLDASEVADKDVSEETLQSVLRSLNLTDTLNDKADVWLADKEEPQ